MRHLKYSLPEQISGLICAEQSTTGAADLIINGSGASIYPAQFVFKGYAATILLSSTDDNTGANFTIYGMLNNQPVEETVIGSSSGNDVYGQQLFDSITRIAADRTVSDVQVTIGELAIFTFYPFGKAYSLSIQDTNSNSGGDAAIPFLVISSLSDIDITQLTIKDHDEIDLPNNFNVIKAFNSDEYEYFYSTTDITWSVAIATMPQPSNGADVVMYIAE